MREETSSEKGNQRPHNLTELHKELIHYMANYGRQNRDNPYALGNDPHEPLHGATPVTQMLSNPDPLSLVGRKNDGRVDPKRGNIEHAMESCSVVDGRIPLGEWLRHKLSPTSWFYDSSSKSMPRYIMAMLLENDDDKVALANETICRLEPYSMRTRPIHRDPKILPFGAFREYLGLTAGHFESEFDDFTITDWTRLYYLALNDPRIRLNERSKEHLLHGLMKFEGPDYVSAISNTNSPVLIAAAQRIEYPVTRDGIQNSENHLLMINGGAYLKNQLTHPEINAGSPLERGLCDHLEKLYREGLTEFNSIPYAGYTVDALLNLHDFAHEPVKGLATRVLDKIAYDYALHSTHDGKNFRPFARHIKKVKEKDFMVGDSVRPFIMAWLGGDLSFYRQMNSSRYASFALTALTTNYRPPEVVYELMRNKERGYLALTGQPHGNAEISYKNSYSVVLPSGEVQTRQYLLSGGGVCEEPALAKNLLDSSYLNLKGERSTLNAQIRMQRYAGEVVSRNPTLIVDGEDGPHTLAEAFYLGSNKAIEEGPGCDSRGKNNSGIYFDTMVGAYAVHIPDKYQGTGIMPQTSSPWVLYEVSPGLRVAVFDAQVRTGKKGLLWEEAPKQLGIILVLPGNTPDSQTLINTIALENQPSHLMGQESFVLSKLSSEEMELLKRYLPRVTKIQSIDSTRPDYLQMNFSKKEVDEIVAGLKTKPEAKPILDKLVYGRGIKFPDECGSVMRGQTVGFNPESALDRWIISGTKHHPFTDKDRKFYRVQLSDGDYAPGWHGSVLQETPDSPAVNSLHEGVHDYGFLNAGAAEIAHEDEERGNLKTKF